jgi:hypothetical protein
MITLSSNDLTLMLYIIGRSKIPLTSQEIRNQIDISNSKKKSGWYGHKILEELVPTGKIMRDKRIFVLEEIVSKDINKKFGSISNLENVLDLNWNISKEDLETKAVKVKEENIDTKKVEHPLNLYIEVYCGKTRKITITNKDSENKELVLVTISEGDHKEIKRLFIENNQQKKLTLYTIKENSNPVNYLDITYEDETQKIISSLENDIILGSNNSEVLKGINQENWNIAKEIESTINIENKKSARSKWRFSLNLRGFLLYLNSENHSNIERIKEVLSNPIVINKFIFLKSWEKFTENGFKVMEKLLEIANEFKNQLEYNEHYLLIRITERYLFEIDKHFSKYGSFSHPYLSPSQETENMLNQYRLMVLEFLEKELILYTKNISKQIRYIKSGIDE